MHYFEHRVGVRLEPLRVARDLFRLVPPAGKHHVSRCDGPHLVLKFLSHPGQDGVVPAAQCGIQYLIFHGKVQLMTELIEMMSRAISAAFSLTPA